LQDGTGEVLTLPE